MILWCHEYSFPSISSTLIATFRVLLVLPHLSLLLPKDPLHFAPPQFPHLENLSAVLGKSRTQGPPLLLKVVPPPPSSPSTFFLTPLTPSSPKRRPPSNKSPGKFQIFPILPPVIFLVFYEDTCEVWIFFFFSMAVSIIDSPSSCGYLCTPPPPKNLSPLFPSKCFIFFEDLALLPTRTNFLSPPFSQTLKVLFWEVFPDHVHRSFP